MLEVFERNLHAPFEIAGDAALLKALFEQAVAELLSICAPLAILGCFVEPGLQKWLDLGEVDEDVLAFFYRGRAATQTAHWLLQLNRVVLFAAVLALVTSCWLVTAERTGAEQVAIGEEARTLLAEVLLDGLLRETVALMQAQEDVLGDLGMHFCAGASKDREIDIKPLINVRVDLVVLLAHLLWRHSVLQRFRLGRCPVLISPADVDRVVTPQPREARVNVRREHAAD